MFGETEGESLVVPASLGREVGKGSIITKAKRLKKKPFLHFTCKQSSSTPGLASFSSLSLTHGRSIFVRLSSSSSGRPAELSSEHQNYTYRRRVAASPNKTLTLKKASRAKPWNVPNTLLAHRIQEVAISGQLQQAHAVQNPMTRCHA